MTHVTKTFISDDDMLRQKGFWICNIYNISTLYRNIQTSVTPQPLISRKLTIFTFYYDFSMSLTTRCSHKKHPSILLWITRSKMSDFNDLRYINKLKKWWTTKFFFTKMPNAHHTFKLSWHYLIKSKNAILNDKLFLVFTAANEQGFESI